MGFQTIFNKPQFLIEGRFVNLRTDSGNVVSASVRTHIGKVDFVRVKLAVFDKAYKRDIVAEFTRIK